MFAVDFGDFDDRNVKCAAAEVIDGDFFVALFLVHAESECGRSRLVDDALDFQTSDTAGVFGRLALAVIEVGRNGDDRFRDFFAEVVFGGFLHLAQDFCGNLLWSDLAIAHFNPSVAIVSLENLERHQADVFLHFLFFEAATDQALDSVQRILGVGDRLTLGRRATENLAILGVSDDRRRGACAFGVFDNFRLAVFHHGNAGVGGAEVDTNDFTHIRILFSLFENVFRVSECVAMSSKLGRHPFFQAFLEIVLFLGLGNDDERRAQHAVGDQVTLLQDIDDGVRFLFRVDHADRLMEVRVEFFALRVDFREV